MKTIYELDDVQYIFNNEAFAEYFMPETLEMSRAKRKTELIEQEDLGVIEGTVEAWFKGHSTPSDISIVKKIAHYLEIDLYKLLIQTDEVMEHVKAATNISFKKTAMAFADQLLDKGVTTPSEAPNYIEPKGIRRVLDRIPIGTLRITIPYGICVIWLLVLDTTTQIIISPFILLLGLQITKIFQISYFKKKNSFHKIIDIFRNIIELLILSIMLFQIFCNC